ncbi:head-tail connector protein [Algiphilus sp.]|uniref:head-tail connector protein n=1 Tax=Algiphilus sp. TaxID=1872431 RepID=UPI003CCB8702
MALTRVQAPQEEPLTVADAKAQAIVQVSTDDSLIEAYIQTAREHVEAFVKRSLVTQTWRLTLDCWSWMIYLPQPPVQSVSSIKYLDDQGVQQTLDPAHYRVDVSGDPARITPAYGYTWPSVQPVISPIEIEYVAGYGDAADVPQAFKHAMRLHIAAMYEFREDFVAGTIITQLPEGAKSFLWPHIAYTP